MNNIYEYIICNLRVYIHTTYSIWYIRCKIWYTAKDMSYIISYICIYILYNIHYTVYCIYQKNTYINIHIIYYMLYNIQYIIYIYTYHIYHNIYMIYGVHNIHMHIISVVHCIVKYYINHTFFTSATNSYKWANIFWEWSSLQATAGSVGHLLQTYLPERWTPRCHCW